MKKTHRPAIWENIQHALSVCSLLFQVFIIRRSSELTVAGNNNELLIVVGHRCCSLLLSTRVKYIKCFYSLFFSAALHLNNVNNAHNVMTEHSLNSNVIVQKFNIQFTSE